MPLLVTSEAGQRIAIPIAPAPYRLVLEDGRVFEGTATADMTGASIPAILEPGYHRLDYGDQQSVVAVAPGSCVTAPELLRGSHGFGLAVQLYSLRRAGDAGIGDFSALAQLAGAAALHGAQALAISPVHAQFSADPRRFSPYAPSSRTALNVLHAAIDEPEEALAARGLIDWPAATVFRLGVLRRMWARVREDPVELAALAAFRNAGGETLRDHAVFEALHGHFFGQDETKWHWRSWPAAYQTVDAPAVAAFAVAHEDEVSFHAWLQFRADRGLAEAQAACRSAGMGIGLISDLAVGADSGGSQCWSRRGEILQGLSVGCPPDLVQRDGQNWGLTAFSPGGLRASGFASYRDMLRTALAHAGGLRIDHAMGVNRLWVIPDGALGSQGAYVAYPEADLMRLIKLESQRHRALILAEDLGTVPDGFQDRLRAAGIYGLRVLFFEREQDGRFRAPVHWTRRAAAVTTTHDLPTVAGWWAGRDLEWLEGLGRLDDPAAARAQRAADRPLLWQAFCESGAASGEVPEEAGPVLDAACLHVGRGASELVILPMEDAIGLVEQPNLPGTILEHPNWQRRLPEDVAVVLDGAAERLGLLRQGREESLRA
jgi:4-alpha-glucanotransferase